MDIPVLKSVLMPLEERCQSSRCLRSHPLRFTDGAGSSSVMPRYFIQGPAGGGELVRIGFFAGIHGDETAGVHALIHFFALLNDEPGLARGYELTCYPVCNPGGFIEGTRCSRTGKDLNRQFWTGSGEPEVRLLEQEIRSNHFHGLVSLHADDTSDGIYGFVRGAVLSKGLLEPALRAAEKVLPRNRNSVIDGFAAEDGIISECYDGILTSPPKLQPSPFEIILETPQGAPVRRQRDAFIAALRTIPAEYQKLLSYAADL